jgi:hypothetical protein
VHFFVHLAQIYLAILRNLVIAIASRRSVAAVRFFEGNDEYYFAGLIGDFKLTSIWLSPGAYSLSHNIASPQNRLTTGSEERFQLVAFFVFLKLGPVSKMKIEVGHGALPL